MNLNISELVIEITRKCNMCCEHCLRGQQENINANINHFKEFATINKLKNIDSITFTGGEPSLNHKYILEFIGVCEELQIEVDSFYIVTNGKKINDDFILALIKLHCFTNYNEENILSISNSIWHEENKQDDKNKLINSLKFVNVRNYLDYDSFLINEGNAYENGIGSRDTNFTNPSFDIYNEKININDGLIYLNALGDILIDCDLSYKSQLENTLCNYNDNLIEKLEKSC